MIYTAEHQPQVSELRHVHTGMPMPQSVVDQYNRYTTEVNRTAGRRIQTGSLTDTQRQSALDQRHRFLVAAMAWQASELDTLTLS